MVMHQCIPVTAVSCLNAIVQDGDEREVAGDEREVACCRDKFSSCNVSHHLSTEYVASICILCL